MNTLEIHTEYDNVAFVPGEKVRGHVTWQLDEPEEMELRLFYYTKGKGTRDVEIVASRRFPATTSDRHEFEFDLPQAPYSFSGRLVSIIWALELETSDGRDTERLEFTLSPTGQEIDLCAYLTEETQKAKGATMRFGN